MLFALVSLMKMNCNNDGDVVQRGACVGPTSPAEQHAGVGPTQQSIIEEALQHWCVDMEAGGQVLGGDGSSTDEQRQALAHGQCLKQLPVHKKDTFKH